jgi:polysaccharide chain length determinant protein (PEP-CTERM system associated)
VAEEEIEVDPMSERTVHPIEYLGVLERRKWWFIYTFAVCALTGIALALFLPPVFRSGAMVAVQAPAVSPDLVSQRGGLSREDRLRALTQQLRSDGVLERVAREEDLAAGRPIEEAKYDMVAKIDVELPKPITRDGEQVLDAFEIVYRDRTAERARRIANRLAAVFVEEHSRSRERQADRTAEFIGGQIRASQERIAKLESKLRSVKELHMGKLPEQTPANLETLAAVRQQLETTTNNLRSEQDRLTLLERQMQSMRQGMYSAPIGTTGAAASPQQRVVMLQRDLAAARAQYTDKHPEVQHLEEELKNARAQVTEAGQQPESSRQELLAGDTMYQQLVAERNLTQLRIRSYQRTEGQLQADIGRYTQRLEAAPMVEQELASTQREYDFERENYKQLSERHAVALEQEQIARTRGGERFSVLSPAYLPDGPESPNRLRLLLVALALGVGLGAGMVFGREYFDRSIRDAQSLQDEFDVPVLAEIPRIHDAA